MKTLSFPGRLAAPLALLVASCGSALVEEELGVVEQAGIIKQGIIKQGTNLDGTAADTLSFPFAKWIIPGTTITTARVEHGGLVAGFTLPASSVLTPCTANTTGVTRNCGWRAAAVGSCIPGKAVKLGGGGCGLGSCTGDAMIRVCNGAAACTNAVALGSNDDAACGGKCPSLNFTCPPSGQFTVLQAAYNSRAWAKVSLFAKYVQGGAAVSLNKSIFAGKDFAGATITTDTPVGNRQFRITAVSDPVAGIPRDSGSTFAYSVEQLDPKDGTWVPLCKDFVDANGTVDRTAIPIAATWDAKGNRVETSSRFTFACAAGVVRKCYGWGYAPWRSAALKETHQTCTRMARADYCGLGISHTKDGTTINAWDNHGPQYQTSTPQPGLLFESAWTREVQVGNSVLRGAICLSHARWADMPADIPSDCPLKSPYAYPDLPQCDDNLIRAGAPCVNVCDCQAEAESLFPGLVRVFDDSALNGTDAGTPGGLCSVN